MTPSDQGLHPHCVPRLLIPFRARLVDYLFPMSKVLKIRVGRSGKKKKEKKRQKYL